MGDITGQSCLVPIPAPIRGSDGETETIPAVLECGAGSGIWIERLLEEQGGNSNVDVREILASPLIPEAVCKPC